MRSLVARGPAYVRSGVAEPEDPTPGEGDWPNAYAWRADFWIPASVVPENTAGVIATLPVDVADVLETLTAADIRVVDAAGAPLAYRLVDYGADIARIAVLLPTLANDADTLIRIYVGKDDASGETNVAGVYAGYLQVIDGITGEDLTGNGRSLTPSGVSAGELSTGWPAGVYDGSDVMSTYVSSDWLAGYAAISVMAIVECDIEQAGTTGAVYANSSLPEGTNGGQDSLVLSRLGATGGGVPDVWHLKQQTTPADQTAYSLAGANTANQDLAVLHASWSSGEAPVLIKNGVEMVYTNQVARTGTTRKLSDGCHVGKNLRGKIAEIRVAPTAPSPLKALLEALLLTTPAAVLGRGAWYGPDDEGTPPIVAMPVRAVATAGVAEDIDVAAAAVGSGTLTDVTQGARGTVTIEGGEARYTATGTGSGTDFFTFTLSDGTFASVGRCTVVVSGATPTSEVIPAAVRTVNVATTAELAAAITNRQIGDHIRLTANCALPSTITISGTSAAPLVIRADTKLGRTLSGACTINGSHVWIWGLKISGSITDNGQNNRYLRCEWQAGARYTPRAARDFVVAYCSWPNIGGNRAIDGQPRNGMRGGLVKATKFARWTGLAGTAALVPIRIGATSSENDIDGDVTWDTILMDGENQVASTGSEWAYEQKGSGGILRRMTVKNVLSGKGSIGVRHGHNVRIEHCNTDGRIQVFGGRNATPHILYNNVASDFRLFAGTINVEAVFGGAGSNYPNCSNTLCAYNNGPIIVGYMYSSQSPPPFNAVNVRLRSHTGAVTNSYQTGTTTSGTNPLPAPSGAPTQVQESEVGPAEAGGGYEL